MTKTPLSKRIILLQNQRLLKYFSSLSDSEVILAAVNNQKLI